MFSVTELPMQDLKLLERFPIRDKRGYLSRLYCDDFLSYIGWNKPIAQINHTFTANIGCLRGMHYQTPPYVEMKLVTCIQGSVWDVVVDLRCGSPTFLKWHAEILSANNNRSILIPEGFTHGYQSLSDDVHLLYFHSEPYKSDAEAALNAQDIKINIKWPIQVTEISVKDSSHPMIDSEFKGIKL